MSVKGVVDQRVTIGLGGIKSNPVDVTEEFTIKEAVKLPPLDLPMVGGIILAVVDAALIVYAAATRLQKKD